MPKVTFILPIYKVEKYLKRTIESLKNQTSDDWEAILVDDGSPDGCGKICDAAADVDSRFKVIHKENGGIGSARNAGLDVAQGDYVHFYDPDDEIAINFVEKISTEADETDADVIYFGYYEKYESQDGQETSKKLITPPIIGLYDNEPFKSHFDELTTLYYAWSKVVKRSLIEKYNVRFTSVKLVEDGVFYARYFKYNPKKVYLMKTPLYFYTMARGDSAIGSFHKERVNENFILSETIESVLLEWNLFDSKKHFETLCYCYVRDLQLSIKNISLSNMAMKERIVWLHNIMQDKQIKKAVKVTPLKRILSRNDKIKLALLKFGQYGAVMRLSGINNM